MPSSGIEGRLEGRDIDQIKAEFVRLYIVERVKLDEIVQYFQAQGIYASKQQWKTQITLWNIGKNNRVRESHTSPAYILALPKLIMVQESDMSFAATKAQARKRESNKDTLFLIKGQVVDCQDVERYFKRRKKVGDGAQDLAGTPPGVAYFTPPTSPFQTEVSVHDLPETDGQNLVRASYGVNKRMVPLTLAGLDSRMSKRNDTDICDFSQFRRHATLDTVPRSDFCTEILLSLRQPAHLRDFEIALSAVKDFYRGVIPENSLKGPFEITHVNRFCADIDIVRLQRSQGHSYTALTHWNHAIQRLPLILSEPEGLYCARLVSAIAKCVCIGDSYIARCLLTAIGEAAKQLLARDHPFIKILRSLYLHSDFLLDYVEKFMLQAKQCVLEDPRLIDRHFYEISTVTSSLLTYREDWAALLTQLQSTLNPTTARPTTSSETTAWQNYFVRATAVAYMELDDYLAAIQLMDEQFVALPQDCTDISTQCHFVHILRVRGEARRRLGDEDAVSDLQKAFELAVTYFGIEHSWTLDSAKHLEQAMKRDGDWHFHGR